MSSRVGGESRSERVKRNGSRDTRVVPREFSRGPRGELSSLWMAVRKGTSSDGEREKGERIGGKDERVKSNRRKNLRRGIYLLSFLSEKYSEEPIASNFESFSPFLETKTRNSKT